MVWAGRWHRKLRVDLERLLAGLGRDSVTVAAALRWAGVPVAGSSADRRGALERFLTAVVVADPAIRGLDVTNTAVRVRPASRWHRRVTVDVPPPVRRFVEGFGPPMPGPAETTPPPPPGTPTSS